MAINVKIDLKAIRDDFQNKVKKIIDKEYLLRPVALDLIAMMVERIHEKGIASNGGQIGTYSLEYMKVRTGNYPNSGTYKRGLNKGKPKNAGVFTKGPDAGKPRPKYNRSSDTKVIISLTRQLENSWAVVPTEKGYGIGFLNEFAFDKSQWVEKTYKKKIFDLTKDEHEYAVNLINKLISDALNS